MNVDDKELEQIRANERELNRLVSMSERGELEQCLRLLSIYIALYKESFGELPVEGLDNVLGCENVDKATAMIFDTGIREAISILKLILQHPVNSANNQVTIN